MKKTAILAASLLAFTHTVLARDAAQDEREILRVEQAICEAYRTGDADYLRQALDERYTLTDSRGTVVPREVDIAEVEKGDPQYEVFRNHGQKLRLYGDAAIVNGITSVKGRSGGEPFEADFQFTDTWVHRDGQWKMAASHATRLPPKQP